MMQPSPVSRRAHFLCWILIAYLLMGTGMVSDDFVDVLNCQNRDFWELLLPEGNFLNVPVGQWTHHIWFHFFSLDFPVLIDLFKIGFTILSFELLTKFFGLYLTPQDSVLVSLLFIFFPSHDSIPYWYAPSGHLLSLSLYLYAYSLARRDRFLAGFFLALIASFMVYGSTPIAVALSVLAVVEKRFKSVVVILLPNVLYICYFVYVSLVAAVAPSRLLESMTVGKYVKQLALQPLTFIDATLGPSMWLKLLYAPVQLSWFSALLGVLLMVLLARQADTGRSHWDQRLVICFGVLMVCSFAMFAATGRYPQLAFNLGNRTTFWGSLLLAYGVIVWPLRKPWRIAVYGVFLLAALGISDHWKSWNQHQMGVIDNIRQNAALRALPAGSVVFVSGNQYSRYGPISHIEFLSEDWVPRSIFALTLPTVPWGRSLGKRMRYEDGFLLNAKTSDRYPVGEGILVYDSEGDRLSRVEPNEINAYIGRLPEERRHWTMLGGEGPVKWLKDGAIYLMPRLEGSL